MKNFIKGTRYIVMLIIIISFCSGCENNKAMTDESNEVKANESSDDLLKGDAEEDKNDTDLKNKSEDTDKTKESNTSEETSSKDDNEKSETDELKKDDSNLKKLTMIKYGTAPEGYKDVVDTIEHESAIGVKLDFQWYTTPEYKINLTTAIATNNIDIYQPKWSEKYFYKKLDQYADLTEALPKYAPNVYNQLVNENQLDIYKHEGKIVMLPDMYRQKRCIAVDILEEYVKKYSIKSIDTIEDYIKLLENIKEKEGKAGGYICSQYNFILNYISCIYDYIVLDKEYGLLYKKDDPNMRIIPIEEIPEFTDIILVINNMNNRGLLDFTHPLINNGISDLNVLDIASAGFESPYLIDKSVLSIVEDGRKRFILYSNRSIQRDLSKKMVIASGSDVIKEALQLLDWCHSSEDNYDLINYGIKNEDFLLVDDKVNIIKDCFYDAVFLNKNYIRSCININIGDKGNVVPDSQYPSHQGFIPDLPTFTRKEIIKNDIIMRIGVGKLDKQRLNEIYDELDKEGFTDTVISKYQKQLDAWKALRH